MYTSILFNMVRKTEKDIVHELEGLPTKELKRIARKGKTKRRRSIAKTILEWEKKGKELRKENERRRKYKSEMFRTTENWKI